MEQFIKWCIIVALVYFVIAFVFPVLLTIAVYLVVVLAAAYVFYYVAGKLSE